MKKEIYTETMKEILRQKIINKKGYLKLKLFSNKLRENYSLFEFNYTTKFEEELNPINSIEEFNLNNCNSFCKIDYTFDDLEFFYKEKGYPNVEELLKKDYCIRIKELLIDIFNSTILLKNEDFDLFFEELKITFLNLLSNYLEDKIYTKNSSTTFNACLKENLTKEEQKEYDSLIADAISGAKAQVKNSEIGKLFQ